MIVQARSTNVLLEVDGVPVRVWDAINEDGVPCTLLVHRVMVREDQDTTMFAHELFERPAPINVVPQAQVIE